MTNKYGEHYSVMKTDILEIFHRELNAFDEEINLCDFTFGAGGHSISLLKEFPKAHLYAFDQDEEAYKNGTKLIEDLGLSERITFINDNFANFDQHVSSEVEIHGALLDAGVSSHQFDTGERGFSFRFEGPLDMRMSENIKLTAKDIVNEYDKESLLKIMYEYGEEKFSRNIVESIIEKRNESPIATTKDLEDICFHSYPKKLRHGKIHPATKTFQALRIEVNNELGVLTDIIDQIVPRLKIDGIFQVISFHSLEDRIVKHEFKDRLTGELPVKILTKKPILPSKEEILENSRSRSAKLRVIKRVKEWPRKNKYAK